MVSIKTLIGAGLAALPSVSAYIYGFEAPATAVAGSTIKANLMTSIYVQNYVDYSIIWGITATGGGSCAPDTCVGKQIGYQNFYPEEVPLGNFTVDVTIPKDTPAGDSVLTAAIPYLVGAGGLTKVQAYNSTIVITAA
ncbi:hypothetical protein PG993_014758 [Apiospora rasikravindrae]|uniref:Uncharacterized protein n=1 Tax=Apiospora rasikravindrae TaxID=990691 RepID=A0ABR1RNP4_9PEZI